MKQDTRPAPVMEEAPAPVVYAQIEDFARLSIQKLLQQVLEEEVEALLGRTRSERRIPDSPLGYRNGHGKERRLDTSIGTISLRRPRVRNTEESFVSRVLPLFQRRTAEIGQMLPQLYLHGLSSGDFELAMRGLLGVGAPLSASSIARLREGWAAEFITWKQRSLKDKQIAYLWVDGIYVKAGLEKDKAALLVVNRPLIYCEAGAREHVREREKAPD